MRRIDIVRLALAASVALVPAGCGGGGNGRTPPVPVSLSGATNNHGTKTASDTMELELDDFYFGPTFIKAKAGQRIELELKNEGQAVHTFTSAALGNLDEQLAGGTSKKVTLTAPQQGQALFFCRFHQGQGMQGAVFVG